LNYALYFKFFILTDYNIQS